MTDSNEELARLNRLTHTNPAAAFDGLVRLVANRGRSLEAEALLEDLVASYTDQWFDAIEVEAEATEAFAEVVANATISDARGSGVGRFLAVQRGIRMRGWESHSGRASSHWTSRRRTSRPVRHQSSAISTCGLPAGTYRPIDLYVLENRPASAGFGTPSALHLAAAPCRRESSNG
jgi:hypothetical protein